MCAAPILMRLFGFLYNALRLRPLEQPPAGIYPSAAQAAPILVKKSTKEIRRRGGGFPHRLENQESNPIQHSRVIGHRKGQQEPTDCDFVAGWLLCFG